MDAAMNQREQKNRRTGVITSTLVHALLLLILFMSILTFPDPPPGQSGILVALGEPDAGMEGEPAKDTAPAPSEPVEEVEDTEEPEVEEPEPEPEPPVEEAKPEPEKPKLWTPADGGSNFGGDWKK